MLRVTDTIIPKCLRKLCITSSIFTENTYIKFYEIPDEAFQKSQKYLEGLIKKYTAIKLRMGQDEEQFKKYISS